MVIHRNTKRIKARALRENSAHTAGEIAYFYRDGSGWKTQNISGRRFFCPVGTLRACYEMLEQTAETPSPSERMRGYPA